MRAAAAGLLRWARRLFDVRARYDERRRQLDLRILWPACKQNAPDLDRAKAAFAVHAFNDDAWAPLGPDEIYRRIEALK